MLAMSYWLSSLRVESQRSQPPDNFGHNANMDSLVEGEHATSKILVPAVGPLEDRILRALRDLDLCDIFGMYAPINRSEGGAPVYVKKEYMDSFEDEDFELFVWHVWVNSRLGQWYIGPRDRVGTNFGIAKSKMQAWDRGVPQFPIDGWEIQNPDVSLSAPSEDKWQTSSLHFLTATELMRRVVIGAAFRVLAPVDMDGGTRTFQYMGEMMSARPRYRTVSGPGKRLTLWWHESLESWCVGPEWEAKSAGLTSMRSWPHCHLRTRDPAMLPEWIQQPWEQLAPSWQKYQGDKKATLKHGLLSLQNSERSSDRETPSFTYIPGQVVQLPRASSAVATLHAHQSKLWWMCILSAIAFVAYRHLQQVVQLITTAAPARQRRGAAAQAARREARQKRAASEAVASATANDHSWWEALHEHHDALEDAAESERPEFLCTLTRELMRTPAMLCKDGVAMHTYEKAAIVKWIVEDGKRTEPNTNETLPPYGKRTTIVVNQDRQREIRAWAEAKVAEWQADTRRVPAQQEPARRGVHIFVDFSNITLGAPRPLDLTKLAEFAEDGRSVFQRVVIGSRTSEKARAEWEALQYTVTSDRSSGKEKFVDDALHAQLMQTAGKTFAPSRVLALATGDGNANEGRTTFPGCVERALQCGWDVELISWRGSTSRVYVKFEREYGDHFRIRYLDGVL